MASKRPDFRDGASPGKIFIGGLAKDTTIDTFEKYFGKYGELTDWVIMKDRQTGRPRGFGFVTYADPSVVDTVIAETHVINGKQVEIKRTIPKGSGDSKDFKTKKVFVGGIPTSVTEDELKDFFSKYGKVVEREIIRDHATKRSRGFGFIVFDSEQVVDTLLVDGNMIEMNGTKVEIKKAEPKKSSNPGPMSYGGEPRGRGYSDSYGGYGDSYGGGYGSGYGGAGGGGGGGGGYGPPYRSSLGGLSSRYGDYGGYGPSGGEFSSRYGDFGGDYGGYRSGEPPLGGYTSRFSSFGSGGYSGGGYGVSGLGGYGRGGGGSGGGYGGYDGPGSGGGYESSAGYESGAGSGYGGVGGPYGSRGGYGGGGSRYHPYGR